MIFIFFSLYFLFIYLFLTRKLLTTRVCLCMCVNIRKYRDKYTEVFVCLFALFALASTLSIPLSLALRNFQRQQDSHVAANRQASAPPACLRACLLINLFRKIMSQNCNLPRGILCITFLQQIRRMDVAFVVQHFMRVVIQER